MKPYLLLSCLLLACNDDLTGIDPAFLPERVEIRGAGQVELQDLGLVPGQEVGITTVAIDRQGRTITIPDPVIASSDLAVVRFDARQTSVRAIGNGAAWIRLELRRGDAVWRDSLLVFVRPLTGQ